MSKKAFLIAFACFSGGLLLGIGGALFLGGAYSGKQIAEGLALIKEVEIAESGRRAFAAYQHETPHVAIYALNRYLEELKEAEEVGNANPLFATRPGINFDTMLVHARLAKVYASTGQTNSSTQHIADALRRANQDQRLRIITNETALMEIVARVDSGATK